MEVCGGFINIFYVWYATKVMANLDLDIANVNSSPGKEDNGTFKDGCSYIEIRKSWVRKTGV